MPSLRAALSALAVGHAGPRRRSRAWVLGFLLLLALPLAQSLAAAHALSHLGSAAEQGEDEGGDGGLAHGQVCGLCLAAAALDHIGSAPATGVLPLLAAAKAAPPSLGPAWLGSGSPAAYRSRAPPVLPV